MGNAGAVLAATGAAAELVTRIEAGDRLAEEEFVNAYRRGLLIIAAARTRDREAARDLTQEILLAVLKAIRARQLREAHKLTEFVHGTARNLINNYIRERARRLECDLESAGEPQADPTEELESADRRRVVSQEIERFSVTDQQILLWSLVDGHSLVEVAERLNMSHDAVRARRSRLIKKIKKKFARTSQK